MSTPNIDKIKDYRTDPNTGMHYIMRKSWGSGGRSNTNTARHDYWRQLARTGVPLKFVPYRRRR